MITIVDHVVLIFLSSPSIHLSLQILYGYFIDGDGYFIDFHVICESK